jgi:hypothetical protein
VIWLTWRQQRTETLIAAALLVALAVVLIPTGLHVASVYDQEGIGPCLAQDSGSCSDALQAFNSRFAGLLGLVGWFTLLPGILAILLAAPFVLELEQGTFRLAWTQSITRRRWLTTKLTLIVAGALLAALITSLLLTWWRIPFDNFGGRFDTGFESEAIVPLAYTVFAVALVIALGAVLRRTAPAIGLALIGFIAARVVVGGFLRPHYLAPLTATWSGNPATSGPDLRTTWLIRQDLSDAHGGAVRDLPSVVEACGASIQMKLGDAACLAQHGVFNHAVYHPASRFWLFQGIEAAIFLGLALALGGFVIWWMRDRIS